MWARKEKEQARLNILHSIIDSTMIDRFKNS